MLTQWVPIIFPETLLIEKPEKSRNVGGENGKEGVTEKLKMQNQMEWVGRMNNFKNAAEEQVLKETVYL